MIAGTIAAIKILKTTDKLIFYKIYLNTKASVQVGELVVAEGWLSKGGWVDLLLVVLAYAVGWLDACCSPEIVALRRGLVRVSVKELQHVAHVLVCCDAAH